MRKYMLSLVLALCSISLSHAQDASADSCRSRLSLGLAGGFDNNTLVINTTYATDYHYQEHKGLVVGFTGRLDLGLPISQKSLLIPDAALRADLLLVQKNYLFSRSYATPGLDVSFLYTSHTNNYISVPLLAELRWGRVLHFGVVGGVYAGYWLTAYREGNSFSMDWLAYDDRESVRFAEYMEFNNTRDNRFDFGWAYGFGAGVQLHRLDVNVDLRWYYGITDIQKDYMLFLNPRYNTTFALSLGLGYRL